MLLGYGKVIMIPQPSVAVGCLQARLGLPMARTPLVRLVNAAPEPQVEASWWCVPIGPAPLRQDSGGVPA